MNQISPPDFSSGEIAGIITSLVVYGTLFVAIAVYRFRSMDIISASS